MRATALDEIDADSAGAIERYATTPNADDTQIAPPPDEIWNGLNDDEKARMLARLLRNGRNPDIVPVKDGAGSPDVGAQEGGPARRGVAPVVEPLPGSPEYEAAKALVPEALKAADIRSGVFPVVEPSPGAPGHATALAQVKDAQLTYRLMLRTNPIRRLQRRPGNGQSSSAIPTAARPMVSTGRRPSSLRKATKAVRAAFSALPIFQEATRSSNKESRTSYF